MAQVLLLCALAPSHADLKSDIDELIGVAELRYALVGIHIVDAKSGDVLYSRNADIRMTPASNQKLLTTAAAYELLGPDFVYHTRALADAKPGNQGILSGPLYLKGSGDPSLTYSRLKSLANKVFAAGVRRVREGVIADAGAFAEPMLGAGWAWDYLDTYYAAEVAALTVDSGCVKAIVRGAASVGRPPVFRLEPFSQYLRFNPTLMTAEAATKAPDILRHLGKNTIGLTGPIAVNQRVERTVTVHDPPLYCATLLKQALAKAGVEVAGGVRAGTAPRDAVELAVTSSEPLGKLLSQVNKNSDNNFAEAILLTISSVKEGVGRRRATVRLIDRWVESFGGDSLAFLMYDGSGLSRLNSVTPRLLAQILCHMRDRTGWVETLPLMGREGTLRKRLRGTTAEGKVRAKTGYVSGVRALSGYATGKSGRQLVFSMLVNSVLSSAAAREMQNKVCLLLVGL